MEDLQLHGIGVGKKAVGDALVGEVLTGKTFSTAAGNGLVGTMANRGAVTITPGAAAQAIPEGYHNGAGTVAGDADLVTANIKAGANIFGVAGKTEVVDTAEATNPAAAANILLNKVGFVNGAKVTGAMANRGALTFTPSTVAQAIPEGYHSGLGTVEGDPDLITDNIKAGANIFGVQGKTEVVDTTEAANPIIAANVLSPKIGFVNGARITGTMVNRGTVNITPGMANQAIAQGYHSGSGVVYGDPDLVAGNIKKNVAIFGVNGSLVPQGSTGKLINQIGYTDVVKVAADPLIVSITGSGYLVQFFSQVTNSGNIYIQVDGGPIKFIRFDMYAAGASMQADLRFTSSLNVWRDQYGGLPVTYVLD